MSAPAARQPLRERLADLTDAMMVGAWPPDDCAGCRQAPGGWCGKCSAQDADRDTLGGVLDAITAAGSDREALAAFCAGIMRLAGVDAGEMLTAVSAAHLMRSHGAGPAGAAREMTEAAAGGERR